MSFVITIDGPAASGKSSLSRHLSQMLNCPWVSTGAFYRGIAYIAKKSGVDLNSEQQVVNLIRQKNWEVKMTPEKTLFYYQEEDVTPFIFLEETGNAASQVSQFPKVREALLEAQRELAHRGTNLVAEGRDCGSVIFPEAKVKFFLTASSESRAIRRALEEGSEVSKVQFDQKKRDQLDSSRKSAPMTTPEGAYVIDTSDMTLDQVVESVEKIVRQELDF